MMDISMLFDGAGVPCFFTKENNNSVSKRVMFEEYVNALFGPVFLQMSKHVTPLCAGDSKSESLRQLVAAAAAAASHAEAAEADAYVKAQFERVRYHQRRFDKDVAEDPRKFDNGVWVVYASGADGKDLPPRTAATKMEAMAGVVGSCFCTRYPRDNSAPPVPT